MNAVIIFVPLQAFSQQFRERVLVLHDEKIAEQRTPDEVILYPQEEYTRRLVASVFELFHLLTNVKRLL